MGAEVRDQLKCGGCGGKRCEVFHVAPVGSGRVGGGPSFAGHLELVCVDCGSRTVIRPARAALVAEEADRSAMGGVFCGGWSS